MRQFAPVEIREEWQPDSSLPSRTELEELGYVIRIGGGESESEYRSDPCKHPSLNQSLAKVIARECPDDAWRMHPRGGNIRPEPTDAMDESTLFDQLLTGDIDYSKPEAPSVWQRPRGKPKKNGAQEIDECCYSDWQGFRVIDADSFSTAVVREVRDDAKDKGLIPVLQRDLEEAVGLAQEMRVRLELAGIDLRGGDRQVPIYWVEFADDGTPVQCRGKLDQLDGMTIRDLKAVKSLNRREVARQAFNLGWHIQAAAYKSGVEKITGEYGRVTYEWPLVRKGKMPAAARRKPSGQLLEIGMTEWRFAINTWARCLKAGLFPGYELAGMEAVEAEPWMMERALGLECEVQDE
jgi:hypothetical protein